MSDTNLAIANLLFPNPVHTPEELEVKYPPRNTLIVTRFGPSPTGFLHIGGIYTALLNERIAHLNEGVFYLRTEDTDSKREVEWAVELMIDGLQKFGINIDEGPLGPDESDVGNYGPYTQSRRVDTYHAFARRLVEKGLAYPCFLTTEEMEVIREEQTACKQPPGIYGSYSLWRSATIEEVRSALMAGKPYTLRFRSHGHLNKRVTLVDEIRGKIEMADNHIDTVLLKKDGIPTYHFAHAVDDHLMRTTHVIRAEEWLPSYPLHAQLFQALDFPLPKYAHIAALLKLDGGNKRKLSKRKDKEANVEYFFELWYPIEALIDYMLNIMDSGYEAWRRENRDADYKIYPIKLENLPLSGALFDTVKLDSISNDFLTRLSTKELMQFGLIWAERYDTDLADLMKKYPELTYNALDIERHTEKDPRRFTKFSDIRAQLISFYDETFSELRKTAPALPDSITPEVLQGFIGAYLTGYDPSMDRDAWFEQLKDIAHAHGFARSGEEWKTGNYLGRVGDIAMALRIKLCGTSKTPDLCLTMRVLGRERMTERLKA